MKGKRVFLKQAANVLAGCNEVFVFVLFKHDIGLGLCEVWLL